VSPPDTMGVGEVKSSVAVSWFPYPGLFAVFCVVYGEEQVAPEYRPVLLRLARGPCSPSVVSCRTWSSALLIRKE